MDGGFFVSPAEFEKWYCPMFGIAPGDTSNRGRAGRSDRLGSLDELLAQPRVGRARAETRVPRKPLGYRRNLERRLEQLDVGRALEACAEPPLDQRDERRLAQ